MFNSNSNHRRQRSAEIASCKGGARKVTVACEAVYSESEFVVFHIGIDHEGMLVGQIGTCDSTTPDTGGACT